MQNFRVGDSNCLTFFDSGANAHLIDRQLAIQEELQIISSKSIALGVIGGGSIRKEYGRFRFNLDPEKTGSTLRKWLSGWRRLQLGFGEYNLKEIAQEFKETASPTELEYVLPETVGGTKVNLLLGIKNTRIQ